MKTCVLIFLVATEFSLSIDGLSKRVEHRDT